jgi:hypothetical protein
MPQLDKLSFVPQLLWFFSIFFLVYIFLSQSVLPSLARNLKLRERVVEQFQQAVKGDRLSEDYEGLLSLLTATIGESKQVTTDSLQAVTGVSERNFQDAPDYMFREGEHLKELKKIYLKEMKNLKLKEVSSELLVEKAD